ncbi:MAPEG family protein [Marinivivus vitaminiproducens]|uniref:MAPEG family protein n=1 Tax=Marinivivus vitaminiproducens TaxID=3035935 RepID=UPI0027A273E9|nr:MAPEG family protein [Geminicoccaceae bacterium SCSIO 64248]
MPLLLVTPFYAGVLGILFVVLSAWVVKTRVGSGITFGDPGDRSPALFRWVRTHGNFAEYVPFALLLMTYLELTRWSAFLLHVLGIVLVVGRLTHAVGLHRANDVNVFRQIGVALTFGVITVAAVLAIATSIGAWTTLSTLAAMG